MEWHGSSLRAVRPSVRGNETDLSGGGQHLLEYSFILKVAIEVSNSLNLSGYSGQSSTPINQSANQSGWSFQHQRERAHPTKNKKK